MKLGIGIPYYKNSSECEVAFKKLMKTLEPQVGGNITLIVYEDGQYSNWLNDYNCDVIVNENNKGVAVARNNILLTFLRNHFDYIMFIDSDDMVDCDFVSKMYTEACTSNADMIVSRFIMNKKEISYPQRSNVAGICLKADFIKGLNFNEDYNISEDTLFIQEVYKREPMIYMIDSNYYYNYGINPNSLMMRFERSEIGLKRSE